MTSWQDADYNITGNAVYTPNNGPENAFYNYVWRAQWPLGNNTYTYNYFLQYDDLGEPYYTDVVGYRQNQPLRNHPAGGDDVRYYVTNGWPSNIPFGTAFPLPEMGTVLTQDWVTGDQWEDWLFLGPGNDRLDGEGGNDALYGGNGQDLIYGGDDDDAIYGDFANAPVVLNENFLNQVFKWELPTQADPNVVDGDDLLYGENGSDKLFGGGGNDQLSGGPRGNGWLDILAGGSGADSFYLSYAAADSIDADAQSSFWSGWVEDFATSAAKSSTPKLIDKLAKTAAKEFFESTVGGFILTGVTSAVTSLVVDGIKSLFEKTPPAPPPPSTQDVMVVTDFNPLEDVLVLPVPDDGTTITPKATFFTTSADSSASLNQWGISFEKQGANGNFLSRFAEVYIDNNFIQEFLPNTNVGSQQNAALEGLLNNILVTSLVVKDDGSGGIQNQDAVYPFPNDPNAYEDGVVPDEVQDELVLSATDGGQVVVFGAFAPIVLVNPAVTSTYPYVSGTNAGDILNVNARGSVPQNFLNSPSDPNNPGLGLTSLNLTTKAFAGDDIIYTGGGIDTTFAGDGDDTVYGIGNGKNEAPEFFYGEDGNDHIYIGWETSWSLIDGGDGNDTADFSYVVNPNSDPFAETTLTLDLSKVVTSDDVTTILNSNQIGNTTNSTGYTFSANASYEVGASYFALTGIENVTGTRFNDIITGDANNNILSGGPGGDDTIDGGAGSDTLSFANFAEGVTVSLGGGIVQTAFGTITYQNIENIAGSDNDDTITGDSNETTIFGEGGNDTLTGGSGDDTIYGGAGNDIINDAAGQNVLYGDEGDDSINGGSGNDTIIGGGGSDFLDGQAGLDTVSYASNTNYVVIDLSKSSEQVNEYGSGGVLQSTDTVANFEVYVGSSFDDSMIGSSNSESLDAGDGNDTVTAGGGNDTVHGGSGNDTINGTAGQNTLYGDDGDDTITGGNGNDQIHGGDGNDFIQGGEGSYNLYGDDGDDTIFSGNGAGALFGGNGNDELVGSSEQLNELVGQDGNDFLDGNAGDILNGGDGSDQFYGSQQADWDKQTIEADSYDILYFNAFLLNNSQTSISASNPTAQSTTIQIPENSTTYSATLTFSDYNSAGTTFSQFTQKAYNGQNLVVLGPDAVYDPSAVGYHFASEAPLQGVGSSNETDDLVVGSSFDDVLYGQGGDDLIHGLAGDDQLFGGAEDDILVGGEGNDTLESGGGNDIFVGNEGNDIFKVAAGETVTITDFGGLGQGAQPAAITLKLADTLDFTSSGLTAETMQLAQVGDDVEITFLGDASGTQVVLQNFALDHLDNLLRATSANIDFDNVRFSDSALEDSFDVFNADSTQRHLWNRNSVTFLNDLDNHVRGFSQSDDVINGQGGDDILRGLSGDDTLRGGDGNDLLNGGRGNDEYRGDAGSDTFVLAPGAGIDTITDFEVGVDQIRLGNGLTADQVSLLEVGSDTLVLGQANQLLGIVQGVSDLNSSIFD